MRTTLARSLSPTFWRQDFTIKVCDAAECASKGVSSILLARAYRRHATVVSLRAVVGSSHTSVKNPEPDLRLPT